MSIGKYGELFRITQDLKRDSEIYAYKYKYQNEIYNTRAMLVSNIDTFAKCN